MRYRGKRERMPWITVCDCQHCGELAVIPVPCFECKLPPKDNT